MNDRPVHDPTADPPLADEWGPLPAPKRDDPMLTEMIEAMTATAIAEMIDRAYIDPDPDPVVIEACAEHALHALRAAVTTLGWRITP